MSKTKRIDCLSVRLKIDIPLNLMDPQSYHAAVNALKALDASLPKGTVIEALSSGFAKMPAPEAPMPIGGVPDTELVRDSASTDIPPFLKRRA